MSFHTEFEIKFFVAERSSCINKLQGLGATQIYPQKLMRRVNMNPIGAYSGTKRGRIRDEGDKVTCTYKEHDGIAQTIDSVKEIEVTVSDFDNMIAIFQGLGLHYNNYQETKREKRILQTPDGEVELCLDVRPGVPEFIEIEGPNQDIVEKTAQALGFDISTGFFGSADLIYETLGICTAYEINHRKELKFDNYPGVEKK